MDRIIFYLAGFFLLLASIIHSYRKYGSGVTFNFFLFAFFLLFTKGESPQLYFINLERLTPGLSLVSAFWGLFSLYAGWALVDMVASRFISLKILKAKILPLTLCSCFITGGLIYLIGLVALNLKLGQFAPGFLSWQWFFFSLYFLSAFFIINFSTFRTSVWKTIFFILPFLPAWAARVSAGQQVLLISEYIIFILLLLFLFFTDYQVYFPEARSK